MALPADHLIGHTARAKINGPIHDPSKNRRAEAEDLSTPVAKLSRPRRTLGILFRFGCISLLFVASLRLWIGYFGDLQIDGVAVNLGQRARRDFGNTRAAGLEQCLGRVAIQQNLEIVGLQGGGALSDSKITFATHELPSQREGGCGVLTLNLDRLLTELLQFVVSISIGPYCSASEH